MAQIDKPSLHFNTLLYTATGTQSVTGAGFQPDMSWVKPRSATGSHYIADAVRGATKTISPNSTSAEGTQNLFTSFDSDGVSLGSDNWSDNRTAVIWNWKANGAGSANTDGTITSTVSANTTAGFSIVAFNGNSGTVGHGLGVKPNFIVVKSRQTGGSNNWVVAHSALGTNMNDNYVTLNLNSAAGSSSNTWGGEPTSQNFTMGFLKTSGT